MSAVTVPAAGCVGNVATVREGAETLARVTKRREGADLFIENSVFLPPDPVKFARVVLYATKTLLESGDEVSGDFEWEIVALIAGPVEDEPMHPVTMARNFLRKQGGTFAPSRQSNSRRPFGNGRIKPGVPLKEEALRNQRIWELK